MTILSNLIMWLLPDPPHEEHWEILAPEPPAHRYSDAEILDPEFDVTDPVQRRALDWVKENFLPDERYD